MNEFVLPALAKRRAETAGDLEKAQERVRQLHADLASLDAVICQFDPAYPVDAIQAKHRRGPARDEFAAVGRTALDMLRKAGGPITTTEVAERLIAERGLDAANRAVRDGMTASVRRALRHQQAQGVVRAAPRAGKSALWELAE